MTSYTITLRQDDGDRLTYPSTKPSLLGTSAHTPSIPPDTTAADSAIWQPGGCYTRAGGGERSPPRGSESQRESKTNAGLRWQEVNLGPGSRICDAGLADSDPESRQVFPEAA